MSTNSFYKEQALAALKGRWDKGVVAALIYFCLGMIPIIILELALSNVGTLWNLLILPLAWGLYVYYLGFVRDTDLSFERLFDGYKDFSRVFCTYFLVGLYSFLWALLLVVPGIIKSYSYSMTGYILKDEPELKNNGAIEKSMDMMKGHKMELFLLDLSFIGWVVLSLLTLGLGFLLLYPYWLTARACFYEDLRKEYEGINAGPAVAE